MRLLVIEDNADDAMLLGVALRRKGLCQPVAVLGSAEIAMDYLLGHGRYADRKMFPLPELILLDWRLPRMEGGEFLSWLRNQPAFRLMPVTVMCGSNTNQEAEKAYQLGANSWFGKPHTIEELTEMVQVIYNFWQRCQMPRCESTQPARV
jgi:CheY-like chemotaxis protein